MATAKKTKRAKKVAAAGQLRKAVATSVDELFRKTIVALNDVISALDVIRDAQPDPRVKSALTEKISTLSNSVTVLNTAVNKGSGEGKKIPF